MSRYTTLGVLCLLLFLPLSIYGSNGAKPMSTNGVEAGRGGTGVAVGDSAHSIALNPAAISQIEGWFRFETSLSFRLARTKFANSNNPLRYAADLGSLVPTLSLIYSLGGGAEKHSPPPKSDEMLNCENCGKPVSASASRCPHCRIEFEGPTPSPKEDTFQCGGCGKQVSSNVSGCPYCGAEFEEAPPQKDTFQCGGCGKQVPSNVTKCPHCGAEFEETTPSPKKERAFSFWQIAPPTPKNLPTWRAGLSIFGVMGSGGKDFMSSEVYDSVKDHSDLAVLAVAPTLSFRLNKYLSIGASFHLYQATLSDNDSISGSSGTSGGIVRDYTQPGNPVITYLGDPLTYDELFSLANSNDAVASAFVDVDDATGYGFGGSIGLLFTPSRYISLGVSYTFESAIGDMRGKAHLDSSKSIESIQGDPSIQAATGLLFSSLLPNGFSQGLIGNYDFTLANMKVPAVLNVGMAFRPFDRLMIALDFRWIRWSTAFNVFNVTLSNGDNADINAIVGGNEIKTQSLMHWNDQMVFAVGLEFTALRSKNGSEMVLQLGYNHASQTAPTETLGPASAPNISEHLTLGVKINLGSTGFTFSYIHGFTKTTIIQQNISLPEYSNTIQEANQDVFFFSFWVNF